MFLLDRFSTVDIIRRQSQMPRIEKLSTLAQRRAADLGALRELSAGTQKLERKKNSTNALEDAQRIRAHSGGVGVFTERACVNRPRRALRARRGILTELPLSEHAANGLVRFPPCFLGLRSCDHTWASPAVNDEAKARTITPSGERIASNTPTVSVTRRCVLFQKSKTNLRI